jgi:hypothetical protein
MILPRPISIALILWTATTSVLAADAGQQPEAHPGTFAAGPSVSPLAALSLDRLSATRDRPLFSPIRRPPAPAPIVAAPPPPPPPPPDLALLGVVMDGEEARAVVRAGPAAKTVRVQIGDDIGGWKVGQIEARQLVLLLDGRMAKFTMFSDNDTKRPPSGSLAAHSPDETHQTPVEQHQSQLNESAPKSERTRPPHRQQE